MPTLNKVLLMGHLTRDPEARALSTGTNKATFGLALNESYTKAGGERVEKAVFVDCEARDKLATFAQDYLKKGSCVFVEGKLNQEMWEDKQTGQKRSKLTVRADRIQFAEAKAKDALERATAPSTATTPSPAGAKNEANETQTDDLPF